MKGHLTFPLDPPAVIVASEEYRVDPRDNCRTLSKRNPSQWVHAVFSLVHK